MKKVKNTIPVYDICSLNGQNHVYEGIMVQPFSDYLKVHEHLFAPHRHAFYHLVFFTQGAGFHTVDFQRFDVAVGQVYFMIPGQVHSWNFEGEMEGYIVNFSEDLFHPFLSDGKYLEQFHFFRGVVADSVIQLDDSAQQKLTGLFEDVLKEVKKADTFTLDIVRCKMLELFVTVARNAAQRVVKKVPQQNQLILFQFRKLVDSYYAEKRLPKDYAAMLYITPNHLNALVSDLLDKSAGEVIRDRILLEAKRLLINADLSISEIAYQLSFTDNSHFTKFFKKYTGATPEEFRKSSISNS
ncbi:helix-turn-helix domain-containing protein [Taibaiella soli]|uniref:AraC family transcriptional regulator n=1 Tax=Taibaiella soli TaxID=1649169 RepID=A0A2W2AHE2_9BACT|nr:helix-turn-helix transcriptional regulator [Taibaiella soli]PZF74915.1 AraC family transcriptional regulator [Taibaiella soli]